MAGILEQSVTLVGPGRAGRAFARSWSDAGGRIGQVILRGDLRAAAGIPGAIVRRIDEERFDGCDILVLSVPDDAIAAVAERLAGRISCRVAFHLSGALTGQVLTALSARGASVGSLHPLAPFTGAEGEDWRGILVAVEGDVAAAQAGESIALALDARPCRLSPEGKPLYHAAASLAAGGTAAVLSIAVRLCVAAGLPEELAREALAQLASRATAAVGARRFEEAFTGAVARRDAGTVRMHARALAAHPDALALYRALAEEILARTPGRGREAEIRAILLEPPPPPRTSGSS